MSAIIVHGGILIGSWMLSKYLRDRDREEFDKPATLAEFDAPHAQEGAPIPVLVGRCRIDGPAVADPQYFTQRAVYVAGEQVAWEYRMSVTMAMCIPANPANSRLHWVGVDDVTAYGEIGGTGALALDYYNSTTNITAAICAAAASWNDVVTAYQHHVNVLGRDQVFGGPGRGGGLVGSIEWMPGTEDQFNGPWRATTAWQRGDVAGDIPVLSLTPNYRGVSCLHFDGGEDYLGDGTRLKTGFIFGESGNFPRIASEQSSYPDGLGYGAIGDDANPIEWLYALLTNTSWGRGIPTSKIDTASFQAAASTCDTEGLGYSMLFSSITDIGAIVDEALQHAGGVLYEEYSTRKIAIKLIRDDYNPATIPSFDETSILRDESTGEIMASWEPGDWKNTVNRVDVGYFDRAAEHSPASATQQDDAAIYASGEPPVAATISYPGCRSSTVANLLASRDLQFLSLPLGRLTITVNRDGYNIRPGAVIAVSIQRHSLSGVAFRVLDVDLGSPTDRRIKLYCIEEHTRFGASVFEEPDHDLPVSPATGDITTALVQESPRWLNSADLAVLGDPETPRLMYLAKKPSAGTNENFDAQVSDDDGASYSLDRSGIPFAATALVYADYPKELEPYDTTTGFTFYSVSDDSVLLTASETAIVFGGANLFQVNGEIMAAESFTDLGSGVWRANNVWRSLLGTRPADHSSGDQVWFLNPSTTSTETRFLGRVARSAGDDYLARLLSRNAWGTQDIDDAPDQAVTTVNRAARPMCVADLQIGGLKTGDILEDWQTYTWLRRPRQTAFVYRGDYVDTLEAGDEFRTKARIIGDGPYITGDAFTTVTDDIDDVEASQAHGAIGHGDAELAVAAFRIPYPWLPSFELEDYQTVTWDFHLHRARQMLRNPSFSDGLNGWSLVGDTPSTAQNGVTGAAGALGDGGAASYIDYTVTQDVDVSGFLPEGLTAIMRGYHKLDATNTVEVKIQALNSSSTPIGIAATTGASTGSGWAQFDLTKALIANTHYVRATVDVVGTGGNDPGVSDLDLRIGQLTSQLLTNPTFDADLAGWTTASGTWGRNTTSHMVGGGALECQSTGANDEEYQQVAIPAGFEAGTAMLYLARKNLGTDQLKVVLESRTSGGSVVDSVELSATLANDGTYHIADQLLLLDLDDTTIANIRVRVVSTSNSSGNNSQLVDSLRLYVFKELHPVKQYTDMVFDNTPAQVFPTRTTEWTDDYNAPAPYCIHDYTETSWPVANRIPTDTPAATSLLEVGSSVALLGQTCAGFRNAAESYAFKTCLETVAGSENGAAFSTVGDFSIDGAQDWTLSVALKLISASTIPIMGSYNGTRGWKVEYLPGSGGRLRLTAVGSNTVTAEVTGCDYGKLALHNVTVQYDATTNVLKIWTELDAAVSTSAVTGNASNAAAVRLGCDQNANAGDVQVAYDVGWQVDTVTKTHTDAWWAHATDPTGELTGYDAVVAVAGQVDSDTDGVIIGSYSAGGQVAIFEDSKATTYGRGLSPHRDLELVLDPDPLSSDWTAYNGLGQTDRYGVDAMRLKRSVLLDDNSASWLKSSGVAKGAGDIVVVGAYRSSEAGGNLTVQVTDSADNVIDSDTFSLLSSAGDWTKFSAVLSWNGATANFHIGIAPNDVVDTDRQVEISMPICVYYFATGEGIVPTAWILDDSGSSNAATIARNTALDARFNHEGEVQMVGFADGVYTAGPAWTFWDIQNGSDNNDRRLASASISAGAATAATSHYDGAASSTSADSGLTHGSEWTLRQRWNTAGLYEDGTVFSEVRADAQQDGRVATWTPGSVALDEASFGAGMGGLISRIRIACRELPV